MQPHQQRVIDESKELEERLDKLNYFIVKSPIYAQLEEEHKEDLQRQQKAMTDYSIALHIRIAKFEA